MTWGIFFCGWCVGKWPWGWKVEIAFPLPKIFPSWDLPFLVFPFKFSHFWFSLLKYPIFGSPIFWYFLNFGFGFGSPFWVFPFGSSLWCSPNFIVHIFLSYTKSLPPFGNSTFKSESSCQSLGELLCGNKEEFAFSLYVSKFSFKKFRT